MVEIKKAFNFFNCRSSVKVAEGGIPEHRKID